MGSAKEARLCCRVMTNRQRTDHVRSSNIDMAPLTKGFYRQRKKKEAPAVVKQPPPEKTTQRAAAGIVICNLVSLYPRPACGCDSYLLTSACSIQRRTRRSSDGSTWTWRHSPPRWASTRRPTSGISSSCSSSRILSRHHPTMIVQKLSSSITVSLQCIWAGKVRDPG